MTVQNTFEDRLLDQLRLVVAANSAPVEPGVWQPRRRRWPLAGAGLATAGVVAAVAVVIAGSTPAAYAIDSRPDGRVTVNIARLSDAAGLQAALRDRGIRAFVDYSATCRSVPAPPARGVTGPGRGGPSDSPGRSPGTSGMPVGPRITVSKDANGNGGITFTIDPSSIRAGQSLYVTTYSREMNALSVGIGSKAQTPPCPRATP